MKEYFIWLAKVITLVVAIFFLIPALLIKVASMASANVPLVTEKNKVAVIDLNGMIMDSKEFLQKLQRQIDDESVEGVVVRINSPGGAVGPSQEIYSAIKSLKEKKPIIAAMSGVAASGGLYAALGASKIYAQPGTMTGSIGVIIQIPNLTKIASQLGFEMVTVKSGKLKDVGNTFREMTADDLEFLQDTVDDIHQDFVRAVAEGRNLSAAEVQKFADGRIITGSQAKDLKLIDDIGGVIEASRAVFDAKGQPLKADESPNIVYPEDKFEKFRKFLSASLDLPIRLMQGWQGARYELLYLM